MFGSLFYIWKNYFLAFRFGDMMYFSRTFTLLLRRKETTLNNSSLLCERSVQFAPERKFVASNNEAILTFWPLKNTLFKFYKRDSATLELF